MKGNLPDIVQENIQAKIRSTGIISNVAQAIGGIWMNCGNKLEAMLGYGTLYGDWGGAFGPIGDLTKIEVYELAKYINKRFKKECGFSPIPKSVIDFKVNPPSAELRSNQVDPIKIGYHCAIVEKVMDYRKVGFDQIVKWWHAGILHKELDIPLEYMEGVMSAAAFHSDINWVERQMKISVFKRVQSPPNIITSKTAFGYDLRESILPYTGSSFSLIEARRGENKRYNPDLS